MTWIVSHLLSQVADWYCTNGNWYNAVTFAIDSTVATLTGSQTLTNKTLTSPVISTISNTGTVTLPTATDTLVGRATTDTLTNKTLMPTINSSNVNGTLLHLLL